MFFQRMTVRRPYRTTALRPSTHCVCYPEDRSGRSSRHHGPSRPWPGSRWRQRPSKGLCPFRHGVSGRSASAFPCLFAEIRTPDFALAPSLFRITPFQMGDGAFLGRTLHPEAGPPNGSPPVRHQSVRSPGRGRFTPQLTDCRYKPRRVNSRSQACVASERSWKTSFSVPSSKRITSTS